MDTKAKKLKNSQQDMTIRNILKVVQLFRAGIVTLKSPITRTKTWRNDIHFTSGRISCEGLKDSLLKSQVLLQFFRKSRHFIDLQSRYVE